MRKAWFAALTLSVAVLLLVLSGRSRRQPTQRGEADQPSPPRLGGNSALPERNGSDLRRDDGHFPFGPIPPAAGSVVHPDEDRGRSAPAQTSRDELFPGAELLALREHRLAQPNHIRRRRLLRTDFKYPLILLDETVRADGKHETILRRIGIVADHILVVLHPSATMADLEKVNRRFKARIRKILHTPRHYLVAFPSASAETVYRRLSEYAAVSETVEEAALDYILERVGTVPNDPDFGQLWGMAKIQATNAWDTSTGDGSVVAAVIDTGVNHTHEDLAANMWKNPGEAGFDTNGLDRATNNVDDDANGFIDDVYGWDFYNNDSNPMDDHSHGSHCAGTIAAVGNNSTGVVGVTWNAKIMGLKFMYPLGNGQASGSSSDAIECINYATMMATNGVNLRVSNNSWGGGSYSTPLKNAIEASGAAGMLFAVAAGNGGLDGIGDDIDEEPFFPAKYDSANIISVANTTQSDGLAPSSNYGDTHVDLGAPGTSIRSTLLADNYGNKSGTSMATPHVVGVITLLAGIRPDLSISELRAVLLAGVDPVAALSGKTVTGGRLNAFNSVQLLAPQIAHTPLMNITNATDPIVVAAAIRPGFLMNSNRVFVLWNTTGSTNSFTSNLMTRIDGITNATFEGQLPAQALGTTVYYSLEAEAEYGLVSSHPATAPAALHSFEIVEAVGLAVTGTPLLVDTVVPDYGDHSFPSAVVVNVSATEYSAPNAGTRYALMGWQGSGSVPASGTSNTASFTIATNSVLEWQWSVQYAVHEISSIPGLLDTTNWWDLGATAQTAVAEACIDRNGTNYCFAEWRLDGLRYPDTSNTAVNPVTGILMITNHVASAVYFEETTDNDMDGLPDWWERFHWGNTNLTAADDPDNDTYTNGFEFLDRSDPRDAASQPQSPDIAHTALADPQLGPPPWTVAAVVTDNYSVASVTLSWGLADKAWMSTGMVASAGSDLFTAEIPPPADSGDTVVYLIEARDPMGNITQHGLHMFAVAYPDALVLPTNRFTALLRPGSATNFAFVVTNAGAGSLTWELQPGWIENVEQGANGWALGPGNFVWEISTNRSWSPSHAWYATMDTGDFGGDPGHVRLDTPPLQLGPSSVLTFRHWIHSEIDTDPLWVGYAYDAGIVEVSTNSGLSFEHIVPDGGYPYLMHGWMEDDEPWPMDTPCFAGTGGWEEAAFDLSAYEGEEVILRFHYGGDHNTDREGWYIDDVLISSASVSNDWFTYAPTNGLLFPQTATNIAVGMDAASVATGDRVAVLRLLSNDPFEPTIRLQFVMQVRSPPQVAIQYAAHVSTNGNGYVVISNSVYDVDEETCRLAVEYSTDGATWTNAFVPSATADFGALSVFSDQPVQVFGIQTTQSGDATTNAVTVGWATTNTPPVLGLATNTRVRVRAWDGIFWSSAFTSEVFMVDNQAPSAPSAFNIPSHTIEIWSTNPVFEAHWNPASDGDGAGIAGYGLHISGDPAQHAAGITTAGTSTWAATPRDGTDLWVTVCAFDAVGNRGAAADAGPYWIDSTAPSPSNVVVEFVTSPYGDYIFGPVVTSSWSGFVDDMSGVSNYFLGFTDQGGTSNGLVTIAPTGTLTDATLDATNTIYVWARDNVGLIGPAVAAGILVLNPTNDYDVDGMSGEEEAVAGTDASDAGSVLAIDWPVSGSLTGTSVVVLEWDTEPGRFYSLFRAPSLTSQWEGVPGVSNLAGTGDVLGYTDIVNAVEMRFYRVEAAYP